jgi:6-phosphogluconate dehydrogenase
VYERQGIRHDGLHFVGAGISGGEEGADASQVAAVQCGAALGAQRVQPDASS